MAHNRIVWQGLQELRAGLRRLPKDLRDDGNAIVRAAGERTEVATYTNYPEVTGNLRKGVGRTEAPSAFGILVTVYSRAPHAHLYERGTVKTPPAPPHKRLGSHAARERRRMYTELKAMMESHGLDVRGDAT
jgi:Bacteriophage HK97-gp10, putative tail-component